MLDFFTGRSNRQEYWISVALLIVVAAVLSYFQMQAASAAITIMWVVTWVRRLHDVGLSGWFAGAPIVFLIVLVFAAFAFGGSSFENVLLAIQSNDPKAISESGAGLLIAVVAVGLIVQFGFTIWLGAKSGDAGKNKFGPPPESIKLG
jgi:uncharacterized membrane protein YhaH (DUF805 family)